MCKKGLKTAKNPPGWLVHTDGEDPGHNHRNAAGDEYYHVSMLQPEKVMRQFHDQLNLGLKYFQNCIVLNKVCAPHIFTSTVHGALCRASVHFFHRLSTTDHECNNDCNRLEEVCMENSSVTAL
jgi:hypothetical protein